MEARERAYDPAIHILLVPEKDVDARAAKFMQPAQSLAARAGMTRRGRVQTTGKRSIDRRRAWSTATPRASLDIESIICDWRPYTVNLSRRSARPLLGALREAVVVIGNLQRSLPIHRVTHLFGDGAHLVGPG